MAFNRQTFQTRTLTAAVFVVIMLLGLLWNQWSFFILFSVIHFGCWWEYLRLVEKIHHTIFHKYLKLGLMMMGYGLMIWFGWVWYQVSYGIMEYTLMLIPFVGFIFLMNAISRTNKHSSKGLIYAILGILYISLSLGLMMDLFYTDAFYTFRR